MGADGQLLVATAFAEAFSKQSDLVVLPRIAEPPATLRLASGVPAVGERIVVIGAPEGLANTVTDGIVSALRAIGDQKLLQISAPISHGSSGGPVLNLHGEVVGVSVMMLTDGQNLNFAVPAAEVRALAGSPTARYDFLRTPTAPDPGRVPPAPGLALGDVVVETAKGSFTIHLLPAIAPEHARHFVKTAKAGAYDGTTFHRIIAGGIIQGGDPLSKDPAKAAQYGTGGLGLLKAEFSDRPFARGIVAAARRPSSKDSGGSQFFICLRDQPSLLGQYTIFGEVALGMEVVDQLSLTPVEGDKAKERVEMKITIRPPAPVAP